MNFELSKEVNELIVIIVILIKIVKKNQNLYRQTSNL